MERISIRKYLVNSESSDDFMFSIYNSKNISEASERRSDYVIIKCDLQSAETVPYRCSLSVDGIKYPYATCDIYFDTETGEASRAYVMFYGIDPETVKDNAYIYVESVMKKFVATDYAIK